MNIEQAKAIPIIQIMAILGAVPTMERSSKIRYLSPLRKETTASFDVHPAKNVWYDHGTGEGGNALDLVCHWLKCQGEDCTVSDALRWLSNMTGQVRIASPVAHLTQKHHDNKEACGLLLVGAKEIQHPVLIRYLQARGIPLDVGRRYLKEAVVLNRETKKKFFALSFPNEEGGYELRNPQIKACIAPKDVTFIRGNLSMQGKPPGGIHIFEGIFDFLSVLAVRKQMQLEEDAIVLNSVSLLSQALGYMRGFGYATLDSWMDNDAAGERARTALDAFMQTEAGLMHKPMNGNYQDYKDVNAWHMHSLGLAPLQP